MALQEQDLYLIVLYPDRLGVKPRFLHKWRTEGTLAQEIISLCEQRVGGDETREEWHGWFLDNHHSVLDGNMDAYRVTIKNDWQAMLQTGWRYSGRTDV